MAKRGRKNKKEYILENLDTIRKLMEKGYSEKSIAEHLGIGYSTFYKYKSELIELSNTLQKGRQKAIEDLERKAFETAMGFDYTEETTIIQLDEDGNPTKRSRQLYKKKALPNPAMQQYLLNNWTKGEYTKDYLTAKFKEEELKLKKEIQEKYEEW